MNQVYRKYEPLPIGTPSVDVDKKCGNCGTGYNRAEIRETGLFKYDMYWINCCNCRSTLTVKKEGE